MIGTDADSAEGLGQLMGLQANVQNIPFDSIMPGLAAGKYDLGISSFTDTKDREKTVTSSPTRPAGTSFYVSRRTSAPTSPRLTTSAVTRSAREKGTTQAG